MKKYYKLLRLITLLLTDTYIIYYTYFYNGIKICIIDYYLNFPCMLCGMTKAMDYFYNEQYIK